MVRLPFPWSLVPASCLTLFLAPLLAQGAMGPPPSPAVEAQRILQVHCASCHGSEDRAKGGFGHVLDRDRLVTRGQVLPGSLVGSPLYERVARGEMPPGTRSRLSPQELGTLASWIEAGAPGLAAAPPPPLLAEADLLRLLLADLRSLEGRDQHFTRYLSLAHLLPAGASPDDLALHRHALARLVNALSWHPRLHLPQPIDPGKTVFRVDLRWYRWNARSWERLTARYPYRNGTADLLHEAARLTGAEQPLVRADWFLATAARAEGYHDFLNLPATDRALERLLQVDVRADLDELSPARSGFNGSGVARNNRLLERHDAPLGAYWRSYDFSENTERQNLFERPLGPLPGPHAFVPAGGEIIFHLPNGLLGFFLVDGDGQRVNKAPGNIVSDPRRPDRLVENGLSCLGCHGGGLLPKDDQVRRQVLGHPDAFPLAVRDAVRALYPLAAAFRALLDEDNLRYRAALGKLGVPLADPEPISTAVLRYEAVLDLRTAAAEAGCTPDQLAAVLRADPALSRTLGPLVTRGTVQRPVFEESFPALLRILPVQGGPAASPPPLAGRVALTGHRGTVSALAWAPAGNLVATACTDRLVRIWETPSGRLRLTLDAGTGEVEALAFSSDGKRLAWAGRDRTVRLWEADTVGVRTLRGHTDAVRALLFTPDGRQLLSAGADRVIRVWDLSGGVELDALVGHTGAINALALAPDGNSLLSASTDRIVRLWDLRQRRQRAAWEGHTAAVQALGFSANGQQALSAGTDRTVRVWEVATGRPLLRLDGHPDALLAAAFRGATGEVLSALRSSEGGQAVRRWDRNGHALPIAAPGRVELLAFSPDGRFALTAAGPEVRLLDLRQPDPADLLHLRPFQGKRP